MGRLGVYRLGTGLSPECLDIGVLKDRLPPGFFLPGRHNVTETHGYAPGHACFGRSDGLEDGSRRAQQRWHRHHGKRRRTTAANAMAANIREEWRSTAATNALAANAAEVTS